MLWRAPNNLPSPGPAMPAKNLIFFMLCCQLLLHVRLCIVPLGQEHHPLTCLCVDPLLDARSYEEQKVEAYRNAIKAWNALDGSNRHRIQLEP